MREGAMTLGPRQEDGDSLAHEIVDQYDTPTEILQRRCLQPAPHFAEEQSPFNEEINSLFRPF